MQKHYKSFRLPDILTLIEGGGHRPLLPGGMIVYQVECEVGMPVG